MDAQSRSLLSLYREKRGSKEGAIENYKFFNHNAMGKIKATVKIKVQGNHATWVIRRPGCVTRGGKHF